MATSKSVTPTSAVKEFYSFREAMGVIREYELKTDTSFSSKTSKAANFGNTSYDFTKNRKILWGNCIGRESGARKPFVVVNYLALECVHAADRHVKLKEKLKCKRESLKASGQAIGKSRNLVQPTKKMGCPAVIQLKEVLYFPQYQISEDSGFRRASMSKKLRADIKNSIEVCQERKIIVHFPSVSDHQNHVIGEPTGFLHNTDERLKLKINELVGDLITDTREIKKHLDQYVKDILFADRSPPEKFNRRYYPTKRDIHNYVALTLKKLRKSSIDEEQVKEILQVGAENPKDFVYFRSSRKLSTDITEEESGSKPKDTLLVVYQTADQKRLLEMYGNGICMLDSTYKAIKYSVPLFFVCVKTNIDYQTVGMFVLETELTEHICEGLHMLHEANPTWNPKYFVTNLSDQEINAVESVFAGCHVYICDFHREQEWCRWLTTCSDWVSALKDEALEKLQTIAEAQTEDALQIAYEDLEESDLWKNNSNFQDWFSSEWYPQQERWIRAFPTDEFIFGIHTNHGIACQIEFLRHQYLKQKRNTSLSWLLATIIHEFLPEQYQDYQNANVRFSSGCILHSEDIPAFLQDRPQPFVLHCMERIKMAQNYTLNEIEETSSKVFLVRSESQPEHYYYVNLGSENQFPSCECNDWVKTKLLCKHFFAVFANTSNKWDDLSDLYRSSKYLRLDKDITASKTCKSDPIVPPTEDDVSEDSHSPTDYELLSNSEDASAAVSIHNYSKSEDDASMCREKLLLIRTITNSNVDKCTIQLLNAKLDNIIRWLSNSEKPNTRGKLAMKHSDANLQIDEEDNPQSSGVQHSTVLKEVNVTKSIKKRKMYDIAINVLEPECQLESELGREDKYVLIIDGEYPVPDTVTSLPKNK